MKKALSLSVYFLFIVMGMTSANLMASTSPLLLEKKTYGGFVSEEYAGHENGLRIFRNGVIEYFKRKNGHSPLQRIQLGRLNPLAIRSLMNRIEQIKQGELHSETPNSPVCVDLPTTDYTLWKKNGASIVFAQSANCHQYFIEDHGVRNFRNFIDGLHVLMPLQE